MKLHTTEGNSEIVFLPSQNQIANRHIDKKTFRIYIIPFLLWQDKYHW